ncbi:hypothetical protein [Paraburkholderia sp. J7]|uniref:hypothetical protein n=1 Tax=Paraburkholderia sp. J7 TaxID=2805438 RepID=UPI002AB71952|nr:hypothetical protein [Paraburkholderia sp. J7]
MNPTDDSLCCAACGCVGFPTVKAGGSWVCAQHAAANATQWPAVTRWIREHAWWLNLIYRVQQMSPHKWVGPQGRWRAVGAYCERHGRSDLAPTVRTVEGLPRGLDERESAALWLYRARGLFCESCLVAVKTPMDAVMPVAAGEERAGEVGGIGEGNEATGGPEKENA